MNASAPTANERLRQRSRRALPIAIGVAVLAHAAVFLLTPPFEVDLRGTTGPRMVVHHSAWSPVSESGDVDPRTLVFDSASDRPVLLNRARVNHRVPRLYPRTLWWHREPSSAVLRLTIDPTGRVADAVVLEGAGNGADSAIVALARVMRFQPLQVDGRAYGFTGEIEMAVAPPTGPTTGR